MWAMSTTTLQQLRESYARVIEVAHGSPRYVVKPCMPCGERGDGVELGEDKAETGLQGAKLRTRRFRAEKARPFILGRSRPRATHHRMTRHKSCRMQHSSPNTAHSRPLPGRLSEDGPHRRAKVVLVFVSTQNALVNILVRTHAVFFARPANRGRPLARSLSVWLVLGLVLSNSP